VRGGKGRAGTPLLSSIPLGAAFEVERTSAGEGDQEADSK